jgi:DNA repair exonuclease SbcCD ATPase subunit
MLLSTTEKKAKRVKFNKKRTLIFGGNGTGKSSLIKSIYKTFGATPFKDHPTWKALNPISFVRFEVDNVKYSILKDGKFYAIFDNKDDLVNIFQSVTNELAPFLADLFDFKILLPNQKNELIIPPPAFLFLPYYIDQDISWQKSWSSFGQLQQIKNYREPIASYHTGLRPNEYYETKGEIEKYTGIIKDLEDERKILKNILEKVKEKITESDFNIDIETFKEEIKELLIECDILKTKQEQLKSKLVEFYNIKMTIESQLVITKNALNETRKDYKYATEIIVDDYVDCPTCGAHYENSFVERFEIAKDEERCKELLIELTRELKDIDDKIEKENNAYNKNNEEILKIEALLENKKGDVKLRDIIDNAGRNELKSVFEENSRSLLSDIVENALSQKDQQDKLKALTNKDRKVQIMNFYHHKMKQYLYELDVNTLKEDSYKKIESNIPETGSALPRALTAYYFSIFQVMKKFTSSVFCPIIIDSPNQQAQDLGHVDKILNFIDKNQPEDSQLILGIEELYNVDFNCDIIELSTKKSLLQHDEYEEVNSELDKYLTKIWNSNIRGQLF